MVDTLKLAAWEQAERTRNIEATGSAAPKQYYPLAPDSPAVVTYVGHDAQYGSGRRWGFGIRGIILHTTEGDSFFSSMRYNARRAEKVSSHYHAGQGGEIGQGVPERHRSWTTGRWNDETINVEINGRASYTAEKWLSMPDLIDSLIVLLADLCRRNNVPPTWLTPAQWAQGASRQSKPPYRPGIVRGLIDHDGANKAAISLGGSPQQYDHHDIGPGLRSVVTSKIIPAVQRLLNPPPSEDPMANLALIIIDGYADAFTAIPETGETLDRKGMLGQKAIVVKIDDVAAFEAQTGYKLTPKKP